MEGEACSASAPCAAGYGCSTYPAVPVCEKQCATNADCSSPGGMCVDSLSGNPPWNLCSPNCNIATNLGCPLGDACRPATFNGAGLTYCDTAGTGTQFTSCVDNTDCAPSYACDLSWNECAKLCRSHAECPYSLYCYSVGITIGGVTWGLCDF